MRRAAAGVAGAVLCLLAGAMIIGLAWLGGTSRSASITPTAGDAGRGRTLFVEGCSACHGMNATGVHGRGPSLMGAGAQAADFYLRTGRMPLQAPGQQPQRSGAAYSEQQIRDLVAYVGSLGGPGIPSADPARGSLARGRQLFAASCAGCHQITGTGGVVPGASVPSLTNATPTQIAEAIRIGPFLMPRFGEANLDQSDVDSIARYVVDVRSRPDDRGGWSLGHLGPIPEGMVAWFIGVAALLAVARIIGEREA